MTLLDEQSAARDNAGLTRAVAIQVSQVLIPANPQADSAEMRGLVTANQPKSPGLAALLSFLLVGMGQIYLGQVEKGLCMLGVVLLLIMNAVLGPLGIVILLFNVLDAFLMGRKVKEGRQIGKWQFFFQSK
jgi:TM2 domain-containing membrane protein YozV